MQIERTPTCALYPLLSNFRSKLPGSDSRPASLVSAYLAERQQPAPELTPSLIYAYLHRAIAIKLIDPPAIATPTQQTAQQDGTSDSDAQAAAVMGALGVTESGGKGLRRSFESVFARGSPTVEQRQAPERRGGIM